MTALLGLHLSGKPVLVAGGGPVAARRAAALASDGADVTVVAPALCEDLTDLLVAGAVHWVDRDVAEPDLDGVWLVHAATSDREVNDAVCRWASARRVWSINATDASRGSARTPATCTHAGLAVGVVSVGAPDPGRAVAVRNVLDLALSSGEVDLRARRRPADTAGRPPQGAPMGAGRVILVGGGPGAPDLVTVRGREALARADVVVTDRLGPRALLDTLPADVEVIDVGKVPGDHAVTQEEINSILIDQAQRGRIVVRLKGGDPFVFGRGGEEQAACAAQGVDVEVVPGVSSALSAPASAGIPLTHRGVAGSVHVAHGHDRLCGAAVRTVVERSGTLVILMGVGLLAEHATQLIAAGAHPATPVAVIESATLATQRTTRDTLAGIAESVRAAGVQAPAVIVVGSVAAPGLLAPA